MHFINRLVLFLVVYPSVVVVHELGHYYFAAKLLCVPVEEVSFGIGRVLCVCRKGSTLFALRVFPFGGSTQMKAETRCTRRAQRMAFYSNRPAAKRALIMAGGCAANLLCAGMLWCVQRSGLTAALPKAAQVMLEYAALTHMLAGLLNLLPFPQSDGSRMLGLFMDRRRGGMRR